MWLLDWIAQPQICLILNGDSFTIHFSAWCEGENLVSYFPVWMSNVFPYSLIMPGLEYKITSVCMSVSVYLFPGFLFYFLVNLSILALTPLSPIAVKQTLIFSKAHPLPFVLV